MIGISKNELQSMSTGWKLKTGLSLSRPEMNVLLISWDRLIRLNRLIIIDQEMVVAGVRRFVAGMSDTHVAQPEPNGETAPDPLSVAWIDDVEGGVCRGRRLCLSRPQ
jgi:hypothetical protein